MGNALLNHFQNVAGSTSIEVVLPSAKTFQSPHNFALFMGYTKEYRDDIGMSFSKILAAGKSFSQRIPVCGGGTYSSRELYSASCSFDSNKLKFSFSMSVSTSSTASADYVVGF